ncbi:MAG: LysR family transcriptional regulator [Gammaproteobacteria bacterium]|nr:LysR family transcriptional regulator [Gammaproteobacteria bacterium]
MQENFNDLMAFVTVAKAKSFTKAAAQMGVSQSALSHTIKALEARLGIRLLTRTTRSVSPTEAGNRLLQSIAPRFEEISSELAALTEFRDKPAGTIRITTAEHAASFVLWPKLKEFLPDYPDIKIEINIDYGLTDIAAQNYDAGVRLGDQVAKDMIAVRIAPDMHMVVAAAPEYLATRAAPVHPSDLANHSCINLRFPTHGHIMIWEFEKEGHAIKVKVDGQLLFNNGSSILTATLAGFGLAYLPEDMALEHIQAGKLVSVLQDWCPTFPGYHLYYASRRQATPAFSLLVDALRYRTP